MPTELGDVVVGPARGVPAEVGSTDVSAGDVVAVSSGTVVPADDTNNPDDLGIADQDGTEGDVITVYREGIVVANVGGSVSAGGELGLGTTAGQLTSGSAGYFAWSDAGGANSPLQHGSIDGVGDNAAAVEVK